MEQNRTQPNSIGFDFVGNPFLIISKSRRSNHNQPLLNGIKRKTFKYQTECQCSVMHCTRKQGYDCGPFGNRTVDFVRLLTVRFCSIDQILVWVRLCSIEHQSFDWVRLPSVRLGTAGSYQSIAHDAGFSACFMTQICTRETIKHGFPCLIPW